jgi:hypothetical protein
MFQTKTLEFDPGIDLDAISAKNTSLRFGETRVHPFYDRSHRGSISCRFHSNIADEDVHKGAACFQSDAPVFPGSFISFMFTITCTASPAGIAFKESPGECLMRSQPLVPHWYFLHLATQFHLS